MGKRILKREETVQRICQICTRGKWVTVVQDDEKTFSHFEVGRWGRIPHGKIELFFKIPDPVLFQLLTQKGVIMEETEEKGVYHCRK